jgi:uncharacterized membrane protein
MNTLLLTNLSIGPLMLILSYLYKRFPPKKINHLYGYRTPRSMRSQEAWDCANLYSANAFIIISLLTCLTQIITHTLIGDVRSILWATGFLILGLLTSILLTEIHLKNKGV